MRHDMSRNGRDALTLFAKLDDFRFTRLSHRHRCGHYHNRILRTRKYRHVHRLNSNSGSASGNPEQCADAFSALARQPRCPTLASHTSSAKQHNQSAKSVSEHRTKPQSCQQGPETSQPALRQDCNFFFCFRSREINWLNLNSTIRPLNLKDSRFVFNFQQSHSVVSQQDRLTGLQIEKMVLHEPYRFQKEIARQQRTLKSEWQERMKGEDKQSGDTEIECSTERAVRATKLSPALVVGLFL